MASRLAAETSQRSGDGQFVSQRPTSPLAIQGDGLQKVHDDAGRVAEQDDCSRPVVFRLDAQRPSWNRPGLGLLLQCHGQEESCSLREWVRPRKQQRTTDGAAFVAPTEPTETPAEASSLSSSRQSRSPSSASSRNESQTPRSPYESSNSGSIHDGSRRRGVAWLTALADAEARREAGESNGPLVPPLGFAMVAPGVYRCVIHVQKVCDIAHASLQVRTPKSPQLPLSGRAASQEHHVPVL